MSSKSLSPLRGSITPAPQEPASPSGKNTLSSMIGWASASEATKVEEPPLESDEEDELILPDSKRPGASHMVRMSRTTKLGSMMLPILLSYRATQKDVEKLRKREKNDEIYNQMQEEMMDRQHASQAKAMKNILEVMGGLYNKGAQLVASQQMIMPPALIEELKSSFEDMPPRAWKVIVPSIHKCLGDGDKKKGKLVLNEKFSAFEQEPMAAASIGQVHFATLKDGQRVVVKVLYPEIRKNMYADLATIETTMNMIATMLDLGQMKGMIDMLFKELNDNFPREMDFGIELAHMEFARKLLSRHSPEVIVPASYPDLSGTTLLTQEMVKGETVNGIAKKKNPQMMAKAQKAFSAVIDAMGELIFHDGFFHADPHPGNIMVTNEGRPVLIDWGQCMVLNRPQRRRLIQMVILLRTRCMDLILAGLNQSGFSFPPDVNADTAAMIFFSFDSAISSPFSKDIAKLGAKIRSSPSKINVPTKAPREVIFFARVMQCLRRGNELLELDISALDRWVNVARRELRIMVYEDGPEKRFPRSPSKPPAKAKSSKEVVFEEERDEDDTALWSPSRLLLMIDTTRFHHIQDGILWAQGHHQEADALFRIGVAGSEAFSGKTLSGIATFIAKNEKLVSFGVKHPLISAIFAFILFTVLQQVAWHFAGPVILAKVGSLGEL